MKCFVIFTPEGKDEKDFVNLGISIANMSIEHIKTEESDEFRYFLQDFDMELYDFLQGSMGLRTRDIEIIPIKEKKMKQLLSNAFMFMMIGGKAYVDADHGLIGILVESEQQEMKIREMLK
jgi:hypothetical protein